jgi:hypothetical protein
MLLPANALMHSSSDLVVYLIVFSMSQKTVSIVAALLFLMPPAGWYTQIHEDRIFALSLLLYAFGWR